MHHGEDETHPQPGDQSPEPSARSADQAADAVSGAVVDAVVARIVEALPAPDVLAEMVLARMQADEAYWTELHEALSRGLEPRGRRAAEAPPVAVPKKDAAPVDKAAEGAAWMKLVHVAPDDDDAEEMETPPDPAMPWQEWHLEIWRDDNTLHRKMQDTDRLIDDSLRAISEGITQFVREEMYRLSSQDETDYSEVASDHCIKRTHDLLMQAAEEGLFRPVEQPVDPEATTRQVLNAVYLAESQKRGAIHRHLEALRERYMPLGFRFQLSGPLAPESFDLP